MSTLRSAVLTALRHVLIALTFALPTTWAQLAPDPAPMERKAPPAKALQIHQAEPKEDELLSHRHYKAKDGHEVHSPAKSTHDQVPAGASAKCRDGTYSFSQHRRGTCSHHGGVGNWL
jgi:hypothetical protein